MNLKIHVVQKGDTLWDIAEKHGVDFEQLEQVNSQLSSPDMIMPGMKIKIPSTQKAVKAKEVPMQEEKKEKTEKPYTNLSPKPMPVIEEDDTHKPKDVTAEWPKHLPQAPYGAPVKHFNHSQGSHESPFDHIQHKTEDSPSEGGDKAGYELKQPAEKYTKEMTINEHEKQYEGTKKIKPSINGMALHTPMIPSHHPQQVPMMPMWCYPMPYVPPGYMPMMNPMDAGECMMHPPVSNVYMKQNSWHKPKQNMEMPPMPSYAQGKTNYGCQSSAPHKSNYPPNLLTQHPQTFDHNHMPPYANMPHTAMHPALAKNTTYEYPNPTPPQFPMFDDRNNGNEPKNE